MRRGSIAACQATLLARAKSGSRIHGGSSRLGLDFTNQEIASATARGHSHITSCSSDAAI